MDRPSTPETRNSSWRDYATLAALCVAVLWVYCPPRLLFSGDILIGGDYFSLHQRRIEFAKSAIFGANPYLPAWYPRELCGTPFWSNLQNFPLIPTRWPLLLVDSWHAFGLGVNLAALLSAVFTYLLCRRLGVTRFGSAVAGWTFACAGFYASRIMPGHLPLLEAYPALPLLLWLIERARAADSARAVRGALFALALATACVCLAGHPQLPAYAVGSAALYAIVTAFGKRAVVIVSSMLLGVTSAAFALVPFVQLIARSTRVLKLDRPENDFQFPYWRLRSFVLPWADGWPAGASSGATPYPFQHGDDAFFLDTVCYVGLLPLALLVFLIVRAAVKRQLPARPWLVIGGLGVAALVLAMPWTRDALPTGPWTVFRSPARQVYVTTFALAAATGVGLDHIFRLCLNRASSRFVSVAAIGTFVAAHGFDLYHHDRAFIWLDSAPPQDVKVDPAEADAGDRVAIDVTLPYPFNRLVDDAGVFDSILLAKPYRAMVSLAGWPAGTNRQIFDGSELGTRALAWAGVRDVLTIRTDLAGATVTERGHGLVRYSIPNPLPRAGFVPLSAATYMSDDEVYDRMRRGAEPRTDAIFLPPEDRPAATAATTPVPDSRRPDGATLKPAASVEMLRPSTDLFELRVDAKETGYVRVLETWDPGWSTVVDGKPAKTLLADGFLMAVQVEPGSHEIRMSYSTPGVVPGIVVSLAGIVGLVVLAWRAPRTLRLQGDPGAVAI